MWIRPCRKHVQLLFFAAGLLSFALWVVLLVSVANNNNNNNNSNNHDNVAFQPLPIRPPGSVPSSPQHSRNRRRAADATEEGGGGPQSLIAPTPLQEVISQAPHQPKESRKHVSKEQYQKLVVEWQQLLSQPDSDGKRHPPSQCRTKLDPRRAQRHLNLSRSPVEGTNRTLPDIYVALNLKDSAHLIPSMVMQLTSFVRMLGPERFFVSIYESGSNDQTVELLRKWGELLRKLGIAHFFAHGNNVSRKHGEHRINFLAMVRNLALAPLRSHQHSPANHRYDRIIFSNDVVFCASDVLEMLHQSYLQKADMTCAIDYNFDTVPGFYDTWVGRDINGDGFQREPVNGFVQHAESNLLLQKGLPFQVSCCWNGLVVLRAEPFYQPHPASTAKGGELQFRRERSEEIFPPDPRYYYIQHYYEGMQAYSQCSASEVNVLCKDMIYLGYSRFMVVPFAKVAYTRTNHDILRTELYRLSVPFAPLEDKEIAFVPPPKTMFCDPMNGNTVHIPDAPRGRVFLPQQKDALNAIP
ncbi:Glycosyltransferase family 69 protein [Balamuthia mandrillaris]